MAPLRRGSFESKIWNIYDYDGLEALCLCMDCVDTHDDDGSMRRRVQNNNRIAKCQSYKRSDLGYIDSNSRPLDPSKRMKAPITSRKS